ncbi:hypothetical protein EDD86DRAFT_214877 [Gorgonomyces haynaldii]|nr:hypothetical protein EDD86DRAFT_214877 [Gorgonomyces haynaldii]
MSASIAHVPHDLKLKYWALYQQHSVQNGIPAQVVQSFVMGSLDSRVLGQLWLQSVVGSGQSLHWVEFCSFMFLVDEYRLGRVSRVDRKQQLLMDMQQPPVPPVGQPAYPIASQPTGLGPASRLGPMSFVSPQPTGISPQPTGMLSHSVSPQPTGMISQPIGMMPQPTGMMSVQPTGMMPQQIAMMNVQPTGMMYPQQTGLMYPQQTGLVPQQTGMMYPQTGMTQVQWAISQQEKTRYDEIFRTYDPQNTGFIDGSRAQIVFAQSGLREGMLAHIWSLADIHERGKLDMDEFAVAMHLIYRRLSGMDIPTKLPLELVPPSARELANLSEIAKLSARTVEPMRRISPAASLQGINAIPRSASNQSIETVKEDPQQKQKILEQVHDKRRQLLLLIEQKQQKERKASELQLKYQKQEKEILEIQQQIQAKLKRPNKMPQLDSLIELESTLSTLLRSVGDSIERRRQAQLEEAKRKGEGGDVQSRAAAMLAARMQALGVQATSNSPKPKPVYDYGVEVDKINREYQEKMQELDQVSARWSVFSRQVTNLKQLPKWDPSVDERVKYEQGMLKTRFASQTFNKLQQSQTEYTALLLNEPTKAASGSQDLLAQADAAIQASRERVAKLSQSPTVNRFKSVDALSPAVGSPSVSQTSTSQAFTPAVGSVTAFPPTVSQPSTSQAFPPAAVSQPDVVAPVAQPAQSLFGSNPFSSNNPFARPNTDLKPTVDTNPFAPKPTQEKPVSPVKQRPPSPPKPIQLVAEKIKQQVPVVQAFQSQKPVSPVKVAPPVIPSAPVAPPAAPIAPPAPAAPSTTMALPPTQDGRQNLLQAIQRGTTLRKTPNASPRVSVQDKPGQKQPVAPVSQPSVKQVSQPAVSQITQPFKLPSAPVAAPPAPMAPPVAPTPPPAPMAPAATTTMLPPPQEGRKSLLEAIQKGTTLKKTPNASPRVSVQDKPPLNPNVHTEKAALMTALQSHRKNMQFDSESEESGWDSASTMSPVKRDKKKEEDWEIIQESPKMSTPELVNTNVFASNFALNADEKLYDARVLFDFEKTNEDDLPVKSGDIVGVEREQGEWLYCTKDNERGWIPKNFLSKMESISRALVLFDFEQTRSDELTVFKNQIVSVLMKNSADWWTVEHMSQSGLVPSGFLRELLDGESLDPVSQSFEDDSHGFEEKEGFQDRHQDKTGFPESQTELGSSEFSGNAQEEQKRTEAINEFISTERTYVQELDVMIKYYMMPLQDKINIQRLFSNLLQIQDVAEKMLKQMESNPSIGAVYLQNLDAIECYKIYCGKLSSSVQYLQEQRQDPQLDQFIKIQSKHCRNLDLSSYLLLPMQRITRYSLLLRQLLHYTPKQHPDHDSTLIALQMSDEFLENLNRTTMEQESVIKIKEIQQQIDLRVPNQQYILDLTQPTRFLGQRVLIFQGQLQKNKSGRRLMGYLFNDFLLIVDWQPKTLYRPPLLLNEFTCSEAVRLSNKDTGPLDNQCFQLYLKDQVMTLRCQNNSEKRQWMNQIDQAIKKFMSKQTNSPKRQLLQGDTVGTLRVQCVGCHSLVDNTQAPYYCMVQLDEQVIKTRKTDGPNPRWNQSLLFSVSSLDTNLKIAVYKHDKYSVDHYLGQAQVQLDILEYYGGKETEKMELQLKDVDQGKMILSLLYRQA